MHLRTKLFISIGLLLVLVALVMYFLPDYLVQADIKNAELEIKKLVQNEEQELLKDRESVVKQQLENLKEGIDGLLYLISDNHRIQDKLNLRNNGASSSEKARYLAKVISTNPRLGFIQLHQPSYYNLTVVTSPLKFIPSQVNFLSPTFAIVRVFEVKDLFYGVAKDEFGKDILLYTEDQLEELVKNYETSKDSNTWMNEAFEYFKNHRKEIENNKSQKKVDSDFFDETVTNYSLIEAKKSYKWGLAAHLILQLAPFVSDKEASTPVGILQVDKDEFGFALFSKDLFRSESIFKDVAYYLQNEHTENNVSLGSIIVEDPINKDIFYSNTLLIPPLKGTESPQEQVLNGSLITIGMPIDSIVQELAISSDRTVLISYLGELREGFRENGERIPKSELKRIPLISMKNLQQGSIQFQESTYNFANIELDAEQDLKLYLLNPLEKEKVMTATLSSLHRIVTDRISLHILLVAFGSLVLALLILGKISLNVTRPITSLAKATEAISSGKYEEIQLPDMGKRKDEIAILTRSFKEMVEGLRDREKIRGVLNKVVSKDVADEILKSSVHLGGEDRICTVMFSDIRGFTKISENLPPQSIIAMLNTYMTKMSHVIEGEGGVIDKYVGDEIMALYGAPISHPDHAVRALSSAILMMEMLKGWNKERTQQNLPLIEMGIGIHTGLVVAGNMGAEDRLNYTVIGANVNLASRLCGAAMPMQIILSKETYNAPNVKESFVAKPLAPLQLKGISEPIIAFELIGFQWDTA